LELQNSAYSHDLLCPFCKPSLLTTQKKQPLYGSAGVFTSPLCSNGRGADHIENTHRSSIFARIGLRGNFFTESLLNNKRLLYLHYSGFQASCHSTEKRGNNIDE
jgi:hypothetical protein